MDQIDELLKIQQDTYRSASLQAELYTLQKLVMHLKGEIDRVQKSIDETPVGKIIAPFIPNLASGGIVTRPTLAMIGEGGEPEAVIPLSKMGGMGTMNITVNMPAGADGNDVVQALEDYVRRNGSIPVAVNNLVRK